MANLIIGSSTVVNINTMNEQWVLRSGVVINSDGYAIDIASGATGNTLDILGSVTTQSGFTAVLVEAEDTHVTLGKTGYIWSGNNGIIQIAGGATDIVNDGAIDAETSGIYSAGVSGSIVNNGTVMGGSRGIELANIADRADFTIENNGSVTGYYGIVAGPGDVTVLLSKTSIVKASQVAIELSSDAGDITSVINRGFISSTADQSYNADDGSDRFTNFGTVTGDIYLGGGNDIFRDKGGKVLGIVEGGDGDDTYYMRSGKIDLYETAGEGTADKVVSAKSYSLEFKGEIEQLILTGKADVNGIGGDTGNLITGNKGNNLIAGGYGEDYLTGGKGDDTFVFRATDQHDTIADFEQGHDLIKILDYATFDSFKAIKSHIIQVGDDVVIDLQSEINGDFLTIEDAKVKDFDKGDFQF